MKTNARAGTSGTAFIVSGLMLGILAVTFLPATGAAAAANESPAKNTDPAAIAVPEDLPADRIDDFMAGLSDEQVRRLLIDTLKKEAEREAAAAAPVQPGGLAGFVDNLRRLFTRIQERVEILRSGNGETPADLSGVFTFLGTGERGRGVWHAIWTSAAVFAGAFLVSGLLRLYSRRARRRIEATPPAGWTGKLGTLLVEALLEILQLVLFALATLAIYYVFLDRTTGQRVLVATYLAAFLAVLAMRLVLQFLLAPGKPRLRLLPFGDATARYLYGWLMAVTILTTFGLLTCGVFRLAGASEASHFVAVSIVAAVIAVMLTWMILARRREVAAVLTSGLPEDGLRARLAARWHHFAVAGVVLLWASTTVNRLLGYGYQNNGLKTLLLVGLYLLLDWLLKQVLEVAFGMAKTPDAASRVLQSAGAAVAEETMDPGPSVTRDPQEATVEPGAPVIKVDIGRMKTVIRTGLRIALAALIAFWILQLWGVELPVGRAVARAAFNILIVVLICYVLWEITSAAIQRRLKQEIPDDDEEREEGGTGGSRIGTLLLLLRKFMLAVFVVLATLIILSSLGVDIGPLIAGAGVIGLAIGFGAQTLVKDIIAGMFFLIDDAFRVGDYIEVGGSKGMVERISLRSMQLRHPRGMVNTIPFGDIGTVTNYSRDYIITKLDFRVRYDADVDKIRKIIKKKVYQKIMDNPELAPKLLGKIKSQGVREMDDSAMIMRVKYKTPPGEQFVIRREVYRLMQEAFRKEGIEFAHRNVTVYLPPEVAKTIEEGKELTKEELLDAVGAAAGAAVMQQEAEEAKKTQK
ncbi:MAG TPA: mechanosensitive ion channel family protein [Desulfobacterales bacterium]